MSHRIPVIIVIVVFAAAAVWYGRTDRPTEALGASGTVEATETQLGFPAAGRIDTIYVREGYRVESGQRLASMDRAELLARRRQAEAQATTAGALLLELERGARQEEIAQARAGQDAASQRMADARRDLERAKQLYEGGAISREMYDKARTAFEVSSSQYTQAEEQRKLLEKGPRPERIAAQQAQLAQAEAAVQSIDAMLEQMVIIARMNGIVTVRHREPNEIVPPGSPVLTLQNPDDRWVRIFIREDRIGAVRIGQPAVITIDTFPDRGYQGEVVFIATEAEFTPKNVQTAEERVKLVYAVKVRITDDPAYDLKPGMPADVTLGP